MNEKIVDYLNPGLAPSLARVSLTNRVATPESLQGFGVLVSESPDEFPVEIVRWPAQGWRPVDLGTGDEGGTTQGVFVSEWRGDVLYGSNEAVDGNYILGYAKEPSLAEEDHRDPPSSILMWHANYHPDGGQLFYPNENRPFVVPLALPGDDVKPPDFVCFCFDGSCGLYIHPNVWHEGVFTRRDRQTFFDKQGAVHARVSVNFAEEFDCLLEMDLTENLEH